MYNMPKKDEKDKKTRKRRVTHLAKTTVKHTSFFDYPPNTMLIVPNVDHHHSDLVQGGKFNFWKAVKGAFKHVGHVLEPIAKDALHETKNFAIDIGNKAKSEPTKFGNDALNQAKSKLIDKLQSSLPSSLEEGVTLGAESGAGLKKKRKVSPKMAKRHALVRKLMKEHHMSLPEASAYIKHHGLI
jgi:hypothetical protein